MELVIEAGLSLVSDRNGPKCSTVQGWFCPQWPDVHSISGLHRIYNVSTLCSALWNPIQRRLRHSQLLSAFISTKHLIILFLMHLMNTNVSSSLNLFFFFRLSHFVGFVHVLWTMTIKLTHQVWKWVAFEIHSLLDMEMKMMVWKKKLHSLVKIL